MPYRLTIKPPVLFVSWRGYTASELGELSEHLTELRRSSGKPAVYLSRLPASSHVFSNGEQGVLLGFLQTILPNCATIHHVIEGDGFVKSGRLATVTTLAQATSRPRDFYTHSTVEEGLRAMKALYGVELQEPGPTAPPESPPQRASGAFRAAARIVDGRRPTPRKS